MNVERMREELKKVYPSSSFRDKCNKMSDSQVIAIYYRLKNEGKI